MKSHHTFTYRTLRLRWSNWPLPCGMDEEHYGYDGLIDLCPVAGMGNTMFTMVKLTYALWQGWGTLQLRWSNWPMPCGRDGEHAASRHITGPWNYFVRPCQDNLRRAKTTWGGPASLRRAKATSCNPRQLQAGRCNLRRAQAGQGSLRSAKATSGGPM